MKTFLCIGAGPGIGLATAERFAREGYRVVLAARSADKIKQLAQNLQAKGYTAESRTVDAANAESVKALVDGVIADYGSVDVVHYNAAAIRQATVLEQPTETFNSDLAINIGGAMACLQSSLPTMTGQK